MSDDQIDDLKQFVAATVSQTEVRLAERIGGIDQKIDGLDQKIERVKEGLGSKIDILEQKVDDGFAGIGGALEAIHEHMDKTDRRLTKLEHSQA